MVTKILSINQSDSLTHSGVQADLRDFQKLNCFGFSAITSFFTAPNNYQPVSDSLLLEQIESVLSISSMDAIKINNSIPLTHQITQFFSSIYKKTPIIIEIDKKAELNQELYKLATIIVLTSYEKSINQSQLKALFNYYCERPGQLLALSHPSLPNNAYLYDGENKYEFSYSKASLSNFLTVQRAKDPHLKELLAYNNKKRDEL